MATKLLGSVKRTDTVLLTSANLASEVTGTLPVANGGTGVTTSTGSGNVVLSTSPTLVTPILGTPTSGTLTNCSGLVLTSGVTGTLPVGNGGTGVTTSTGSGNNVLATSPTLVTPILGTPTSGTLTNCTGLVLTSGVTGVLPIANGGVLATEFAKVAWGTAGAESANTIEVPATVQDLSGTTLAVATTEVEVMVSDSTTDAEPSATATLSAASTPVGTVLAGSGSASIVFRTASSGLFTVKVTETAAASRFLWTRQGPNSQAWVRAAAAPKSITFT